MNSRIFHVDPVRGDDANPGVSPDHPWRSFGRVNATVLEPGDRVILRPGVYRETLTPRGGGSPDRPVEFHFEPGRFEIETDGLTRLKLHISNNNNWPDKPKPVAIIVQDVKHIRFIGANSNVILGGTAIYFVNDRAVDISYSGLTFDLRRPTVSEFRVVERSADSVVIRIAEGSDYAIRDGVFTWTGELGTGWTMMQEAIPEEGRCWRLGAANPFEGARAVEAGARLVRLEYPGGAPSWLPGHHFQLRNVDRDCVGGFNTRSRDLVWRNCTFHALTGMGVISQFTENLTYDHVNVIPPDGTLRTCPAWADMFHFSNCRGTVCLSHCRMSGSQDDPVNVHGTHLRLVEKDGTRRVLVRFAHAETFGFAAFAPGDRVEFVNHLTLRAFAANTVAAVERRSDTDWMLTFEQDAADFAEGNVIDNITWHPDLEIRDCHVTMDATRAFLITTRGRVVVERNTVVRTAMSAIEINDDARSWFESGPVRDVTIRDNTFIECGEPVIRIAPENEVAAPGAPVHEHIRIVNNTFQGGGCSIAARSVKGLVVTGNRFSAETVSVQTTACSDVVIEGNITAHNTAPGAGCATRGERI
ncbi:MAG: right-handed parallel beta-helix repeat-containing protein [bacterium]